MEQRVVIDHKTNINGWTKEKVQDLVCLSDKALERSILLVHSKQTVDEQNQGVTKYWNDRGWAMVDAKRGKRWAFYVTRGYGIREWEKAKVRTVMQKYWRQMLAEIARKQGLIPVKHKRDL